MQHLLNLDSGACAGRRTSECRCESARSCVGVLVQYQCSPVERPARFGVRFDENPSRGGFARRLVGHHRLVIIVLVARQSQRRGWAQHYNVGLLLFCFHFHRHQHHVVGCVSYRRNTGTHRPCTRSATKKRNCWLSHEIPWQGKSMRVSPCYERNSKVPVRIWDGTRILLESKESKRIPWNFLQYYRIRSLIDVLRSLLE